MYYVSDCRDNSFDQLSEISFSRRVAKETALENLWHMNNSHQEGYLDTARLSWYAYGQVGYASVQ
jgi:hypothetical protein